jgi:hypothetical protein
MARRPINPADAAAAAEEARAFVAARDRARARFDAPGGGDPFFANLAIAEKHLKRLKALAGTHGAEELIRAEEQKGMRYVFERPETPRSRGR